MVRFVDIPVDSRFRHCKSGMEFIKTRDVLRSEESIPIPQRYYNCISLYNGHRCVMPTFAPCEIVDMD